MECREVEGCDQPCWVLTHGDGRYAGGVRLTRKGLYELVMLDEAGDVVGYDLTHATLEAAKADAYQRFRDLEAADAVMASLRGHGWTCWRSRSPRRHPFTD